jgi:RNA 2',3'-cyclic 3'-phosphodiesterase
VQRLFVAAYPPAAVCDDLEARLAGLRVTAAAARGAAVRLTRRDNWHVTLAFLGAVPDDLVPRAAAALDRCAAAWPEGPPALRFAGGGRFGSGKSTVLWVGVGGDPAAVERLARAVRRERERERLPFDDRRFRPHLTIARPGDRLDRAAADRAAADRAAADRADVDRDCDALASYAGPVWRADRIDLMRGHLGPQPRYEVVASVRLPERAGS